MSFRLLVDTAPVELSPDRTDQWYHLMIYRCAERF
jgi:hypothetical protein